MTDRRRTKRAHMTPVDRYQYCIDKSAVFLKLLNANIISESFKTSPAAFTVTTTAVVYYCFAIYTIVTYDTATALKCLSTLNLPVQVRTAKIQKCLLRFSLIYLTFYRESLKILIFYVTTKKSDKVLHSFCSCTHQMNGPAQICIQSLQNLQNYFSKFTYLV